MPVKPHSLEIRFAGEDYTPDQPQPDIRVENFCALLAHGKSKRAAVILSFPNASKDSASFRASRILSDDRVRDRLAYLRAKIAQATATVSPALSQSVRDSLEDSGGSDAANAAIDGPSDNLGHQIDKTGHDIDNLGHSNGGGGQNVTPSQKRRSIPPPDLTPAELRRIIAEGARNGNSSAINAAIKILDSQMSAPPQVANPAGLCAILFNGGGGGETLQHIVSRLVSVFGLPEIRAEIDRITMQTIETQQDSAEKPNLTYSALCDYDTEGAQPGEHVEGAQAENGWAGGDHRRHDDAQSCGKAEGGAGGREGGEDGPAEEV
jgi:hypothetical protein